jgi:hypothetical protein
MGCSTLELSPCTTWQKTPAPQSITTCKGGPDPLPISTFGNYKTVDSGLHTALHPLPLNTGVRLGQPYMLRMQTNRTTLYGMFPVGTHRGPALQVRGCVQAWDGVANLHGVMHIMSACLLAQAHVCVCVCVCVVACVRVCVCTRAHVQSCMCARALWPRTFVCVCTCIVGSRAAITVRVVRTWS